MALLNSPTTHDMCLEFIACQMVDKSFQAVSSEYQLQEESEEFGLYQVVGEKRFIAGEHKSLSVPVGEPLFPLHWLVYYPSLRLQRLDLQLVVPEDVRSQAAKFNATCEALHMLGRSADTLCVTIAIGHHQLCHHNVCDILKTPYLVELQFLFVEFYGYNSDNHILSGMSCSIQNAKSLQTVAFKGMDYHERDCRPFFNALFSLPREQLVNLTLNISELPHRFIQSHLQQVCMDIVRKMLVGKR